MNVRCRRQWHNSVEDTLISWAIFVKGCRSTEQFVSLFGIGLFLLTETMTGSNILNGSICLKRPKYSGFNAALQALAQKE